MPERRKVNKSGQKAAQEAVPDRQSLAESFLSQMEGVHADLEKVEDIQSIHPLDYSWKLKEKPYPYSCTDEEGMLLSYIIRANGLTSGFEVATAFGFSSLSSGLGFKANGGRLVTLDCYVEEWKEDYHYDSDELSQALDAVKSGIAEGVLPVGLAFARKHAEALGLSEVIDFQVGISPNHVAEALQGRKIDFAYIDGGHFNDQPLRDFLAICPFLSDRCAVVFHDNTNEIIALAVAEAERRLGVPAKRLPTRWGLTLVGRGLDKESVAALDSLVDASRTEDNKAQTPPSLNASAGVAARPENISVVVQGPVVGGANEPYDKRLTLQCLESVRQHLPGAQIVLSTWRGSDVTGLPFDILVESDDPGAVYNDDVYRVFGNNNRQIVTTRSGLLNATREYAAKIRSDIVFEGEGFLQYFGRFQERCESWELLKERVLVCNVYSRNPRRVFPAPFHPGDWFMFGRREDVLAIWNIPLAPEPETSRWFESRPNPPGDPYPTTMSRYFNEQYIWLSFLRKHGDVSLEHRWELSDAIMELSELTFTNNLVFLSPQQLQVRSLKHPVNNLDWASLYTHGEWLRLYKKYCGAEIAVAPDFERMYKEAIILGNGANTRYGRMKASAITRRDNLVLKFQRELPGPYKAVRAVYRRILGSSGHSQ